MNREERMQAHRATREIGNRTYAIWRQPWRICRNRRLRAEIRAIMAVVDPGYEQDRQRRRDGQQQGLRAPRL